MPTVTADESRRLNDFEGSCLILAGAGMCTGGRILHHLRENLWRPSTHVVVVGFQAHGSLGRLLVDGARFVTLFGEKIAVHAKIHTLGGFSAHAGQGDLLKWFGALAGSRPRVVLTHGEDGPRATLAGLIKERFDLPCILPSLGEQIALT
jgi:metallo-beta-lactamase family protein